MDKYVQTAPTASPAGKMQKNTPRIVSPFSPVQKLIAI
jgi:hypothetical protein